jgi:hypothetical protein
MRSDHQSRRLERTHRKLTDVSRLPQAISRRLPKPPRATNTHQRASNEDYLGFMFRPIDVGSSLTCEPTPPLSETVRHYISTNLYCRGERSEEGHYAGTAGGRFLFRLEWWVVMRSIGARSSIGFRTFCRVRPNRTVPRQDALPGCPQLSSDRLNQSTMSKPARLANRSIAHPLPAVAALAATCDRRCKGKAQDNQRLPANRP